MKIIYIIVLVLLSINMAIAAYDENGHAFIGWSLSIILLTLLIL